MGLGIPELYRDVFFNQIAKDDLVSLIKRLQPSPSRVVELLGTDHELRPEEDRIFYFLKDFVRSLTSEDLIRFLQFVTASSVMPSLGITVMFHHADGLQRHPIGRTCGNVLDIPLEYNTLQEFKREFLCILRNDDSFRMFMT
ncbi:E3 ubiquitin-protein ligase UPL1 [Mizuhopecten yessoensis]|uniref:E3 ubiquitin-protein ligase UPL1 n=1 Tax=Mizuhopecten yessoensis TaxID=6573 RepID=A0A210PKD4_MIZYE|nr:E3 ubiquitin-protein ligase UPL1 [Mizuhopecten yessoensis]